MFKIIARKMVDLLSKFSVQQEDVLGVDITPRFIRVAQLDQDKKKWILSKLNYKYVEGGPDIGDVFTHQTEYANKLKEIISSKNMSGITNAAISVPVSSAIVKVISLPLMTDAEIEQAIDYDSLWENVIQLPEKLDGYSVFWQVIKRHNESNTMDLLFVASKLSDVNTFVDIVQNAGLNPVVVDVRCFAIRNAFETRHDIKFQERPIAILEFGADESYILILKEETPYISDLYIPEQDRSRLSEGTLNEESTRKLCERYGTQIRQVIANYEEKYSSQPVRELFLVSSLPRIDVYVDQMKKVLDDYDVNVLNPLQELLIPEHLKEKSEAEQNPSTLTSVIGLATRKLDIFGYYKYVTGVKNINLLPNRVDIKRVERTKVLSKILLVGVSIVILTIGMLSFFSLRGESKVLEKTVAPYESLQTQLNKEKSKLAKIRTEKKNLGLRLDTMKQMDSTNQKYMHQLLLHLTKSAPDGVWLESIRYGKNKMLDISGGSLSDQKIVQFIQNLNKNRSYIKRASLLTMSVDKEKSAKLKGNIGVKNFSVSCELAVQDSKKSRTQ